MTQRSWGSLLLPPPQSIRDTGTYSTIKAGPFQKLVPLRSTLRNLPASIELIESPEMNSSQSYRLLIESRTIKVEAMDEAGWYYGLLTLIQIAESSDDLLPQLVVTDYPDFKRRGVMLDVSRNKVPKLKTLFSLIDHFAAWKVNELQLYIEHAFAYIGHEKVWKEASPLTPKDIERIEAYCQNRFIELVPNLNCFGHMSRWLTLDDYNHLAEQPNGGETDLGYREEPQGLCATDPDSLRLAEDLIEQMTSCFSSSQVNVGCDETIDLGYGRSKQSVELQGRGNVYLNYLLHIHEYCNQLGYRMQFWADIILKYPELLADVPADSIALNWGYEAIHDFDKETALLGKSNNDFYVCPGTSSWCSIGGRTDNMLENIRKAARCGKQREALGLMITDWGDFGHLQPLLVSFPGLVFGAACGWNHTEEINLAESLDRYVFHQTGWGQITLELGRLDQPLGLYVHNQTILFQLLKEDDDFIKDIRGLEEERLREVRRRAQSLHSKYQELVVSAPTDETFMEEADWVLRMLIHACNRGLAIRAPLPTSTLFSDAITLRTDHKKLWEKRNRPGGYELSRKFFEPMLQKSH